MQNRAYYSYGKGQSLLEFTVAMTLGLFLVGIIVAVFQSVKISAAYVDNLIQMQETVRTFFYLLQQDLQQPQAQILNPDQIPKTIETRFAKDTQGLLLESDQQKIAYFVSGNNQDLELHRKNLSENSHNQDAIASGIEKFQIEYSIIENHHLQFMAAVKIKNWQEVKLIKIILQLKGTQGKPVLKKNMSFMIGIS